MEGAMENKGYRLMIRTNKWAASALGNWRPLISGTINQTGKRDEEASAFNSREEAEQALASLIACEVITAEEADRLVEIEEIDRDAPVRQMIADVAALVGHDGTDVLRTIVECALNDDPNATAEDIAEIVREARRDAAIERARG